MRRTVKVARKSLLQKKIREFAITNPRVNEKDVTDALDLFSEISKTRKASGTRVGFRIGRPYGRTVAPPEADVCEPTPLLRYSLD
jgi:hypothetical protein